MKRFCILGVILGWAALMAAQSPSNPISSQQITFPVFATNPQPAFGASVSRVGNPGNTTYYYWIVANYSGGQAPVTGPFSVQQSADTLSGSNYNVIQASLPAGATSYDVLRTVANIPPSGACGCAVATSVSPTAAANDQSNSLSGYTVNPLNLTALAITLSNEIVGANSAHLILRQNGAQVTDLSVGGGGGAAGGAPGNLQYNNAGALGGFADGTAHQVLHGARTFGAVTSADTDTSVAHTGVDISTSFQVTALHLNPAPTLCNSGDAPQGIDANGNVVNCFTPPGGGVASSTTGYVAVYTSPTQVGGTNNPSVNNLSAVQISVSGPWSNYGPIFQAPCNVPNAGSIGMCAGQDGLYNFFPATGGGVGTAYDFLGIQVGGARASGHVVVFDSNGFPSDGGGAPLLNNTAISVGTSYLSETKTAGTTGTTANLTVVLDASGNVVTTSLPNGNIIGIATATKTNGQTLEVALVGTIQCTADNATTNGDLAIPATTTAGACKDAGGPNMGNVPMGQQVIGRFRSSVSAGQLATLELFCCNLRGTMITTATQTDRTGLIRGNGTSISGAELSGDVTTSGSNAATVVATHLSSGLPKAQGGWGADVSGMTIPTSGTVPELGTPGTWTAAQYFTANKSQVCSAGGTGCGATPGDFTTANSSSVQSIPGLVVGPLPASQAVIVNFHCYGIYNQATGSANDNFTVTNSVAPTNEMVVARARTAVGTEQGNATAGINSTSATQVVLFTGASATDLPFSIDGQVEQPSGSANTIQIGVKNGTAANVIIIRRGATCEWR